MAKNQCEKLLADGVFEHHFNKVSNDYDSDYKSYFSSEKFKKDFKDGKFNLGVGVTIEDIPLKLDVGSSETTINEFVEKVKNSTSFKMSSSFYQEYSYSVPNKDLAEEYRKCLDNNKLGLNIEYAVSDDTITFEVTYNNFGGIAQKPKLEGVFISTKGKLLNQTINKGEELDNLNQASFTFELDKNSKEVLFTIDTDLTAQSEKVIIRKNVIDNNQPIGTIITSFLNWEQFQKATDNNKFSSNSLWNKKQSFWSPCDGRDVADSFFDNISNQPTTPDLRGVFIRGLNTFDPYELDNGIAVVAESQKDTELNRARGSFQADTFKSHSHNYKGRNAGPYRSGAGESHNQVESVETTSSDGGDETRPKNRAFYYYIKIN